MTDLDLIQKLIAENDIVQITTMPVNTVDLSRFSVVRKGSDNRGFGITLQEAFDNCKVVRHD